MNHTASREESSKRSIAGSDPAVLQRRIRVARGQEAGDLLLFGGQVVNVFTRRAAPANVVVSDGWIAGVGPYEWDARERISVAGKFVLPGLIDAHMHLESTLLMPGELAKLVVPRGTTAIVADPHEVANVLGVRGVEMLLQASEGLPLDIFFMAPSCVPAAQWESAGAVLDAASVASLLQQERVLGLAEVMDFPAVLDAQAGVLHKIVAALARCAAIDGHAPGLIGQPLTAYAAAGVRSDHECTTVEEALAKAELGMMVQVREGSSARNLDTFLPLLAGDDLGDWCLATDDIHPDDLIARGHIDGLLRRVVAAGAPLAKAVRHATLVPARHYGLRDRGAVAPSYRADLVVVSPSLDTRPELVVKNGRVAAREGEYLAAASAPKIPAENTVHLGPLSEKDFLLPVPDASCPVIRVTEGQILTRRENIEVRREDGRWTFDPQQDVLLAASIERHRASGRVGLGLVQGFQLRRHGAFGSSVAHDSHNLIIAGANSRDMLLCAKKLEETGGGFIVAADGEVLAQLPLPVAGLLSTSSAEDVCRQLEQLHEAARRLGCPLHSPFGTLSFLALSVIPELRITDRGLFDVLKQEFVAI